MKGADDWVSWLLVATLGVIWGGSLTFTSVAVVDLPPLTVATGRIVVAAAATLAMALLFTGGLPRSGRVWLFAAAAAIVSNALPFSLLAWAQGHVSGGLAGILMATLPLIVLPLAHVFVPGEHMTTRQVLGCAIGVVGVAVLIGLDALSDLGGAGVAILAQLACVATAFCYASGSIIMKNAPPIEPLSFSAATLLTASALMLPIAFFVERPFSGEVDWTLGATLSVCVVGLFGTALSAVILLKALRRSGPSFVGTVNFQIPIWAMLFGYAFLGDAIPDRAVIALAIIFTGVALSQFGDRWRPLSRAGSR